MKGFLQNTTKTSHDAVSRFFDNLNVKEETTNPEENTTNSYFFSSQYKHFDKFDPTIQDDVIFEEQLSSLLTYLTQSLDSHIVQQENQVLRMVKQDLAVEIQSVMVDIYKKSRKIYLELCDVMGSELQALSFPKEYTSIGTEAYMLENVALKTEIRTLLSILSLLCITQKDINETIKGLNTSEDLVERLDDVRDDIRQENNALKQIQMVEDDITNTNKD
ncbi:hypothetical protein KM1_025150 [Entamoeba histolytica HM-3:IMSS]|uniref:Uncharacterized protein n=6 Tax=Entamoeba histolytica TaxID=5759 RepID=C4LVD4_ENTH1|nr:hypothetical protein EHI_197170 [Entamoeba histolytica HM-1:IMSS]EMD49680.1 Hypothetical protein EHI5A_022780 [Entamoeba histolytica KU27]EMS16099.1 hypothetical protein KM1_025150 [Entamoeba histolytica HM-3:IMSS]ENY63101.1 hypothetical protein EHI7A_029150 [Entamoeba histolytica HM-1:IMSS-A]GAT92622.1 hypothetical protein CL6EHI_197170 [Entamoeba histolytica]EAL48588.1 hypothetical protein EHI_197170 [Entamoeba histolytica HM-1:IMSS]|eukprot:XP_653974.1 hypothetical protein EHI_197170 [Entamoeba histolytica HM-1:IMSS]